MNDISNKTIKPVIRRFSREANMNVNRLNISLADKKRLIECFSNDEDYILLARHLEINPSSARTIVRRFKCDLHKNSHGGNEAKSINAETGESL